MMRCAQGVVIVLALLAAALPAVAETYGLVNGKQVEGTVIRTVGSRVTIRTPSGVSSYDVMEFDERTRGEHFEQLETDVARRRMQPPESAAPTVAPPAPSRSPGSDPPKPAVGLMIAGAVLCVIASLWFIVAGFAESVGWGIALILFNGLAGIAFLVLHWDRAKSPVLTYFIGIGLIIAGVLMAK